MPAKCGGCNQYYNQGDYLRHIRTTAEPRCRTIYDHIHNYTPGGEDDSDEVDNHHILTEPEYSVDSGGDYFGDYQEDDFAWQDWQADEVGDNLRGGLNGYHNEDGEVEDEEQDKEQDEEDEELLIPEQLSLPDHPSGRTQSPSSDSTPAALRNVQEYVTKFGGLAGTPLPGRARSNLMYDLYQHKTQGKPWGAFQSQTDWEFARWAKLRGPTSTAVSELLNIDGVSFLLLKC